MTLKEIYNHIRRVSLKRMIWPIFPVIATIIISQMVPFREMLNPKVVTSTEEAIAAVEEGHTYLQIKLPQLIYSGYNYMKDSEVHGEYYYDLVDNTDCVFYMLEPAETTSYQKSITDVNRRVKVIETNGIFNNMLEMFAGVIDWTTEGVVSVTKPYVLSEMDYNYPFYVIMFLLVLAMFAYGVILFVYNLILAVAPWMSPKIIYAKLRYEGKLFKIDNFLNKVVEEMADSKLYKECVSNKHVPLVKL